ncbi:efflux RND transporter permease subunit [Falsirhodobacter sp. alg1]|uniref:efflux RND transporter permease subunit n=1 Tax=Falsirhodobacter sp. alg1 TaxID=1472418 RepID=UPI0007894136|nr:efflux RND transporter permease subunit [Falsirhodobacter sp. alg1]
MANFFINRPVFAWVLAIVTMLAGVFGITSLPISQYPDIAPTTVRISASYTGASAQIVENSVTTIIEQGMTGLDGLTYMTSSTSEGSSSISLVFDDSVDPDIAQVQVQNKLQLVESQLPDTVTNNGISVTRSTTSILLVGALVSDDGSRSSVELGDIVGRLIEDPVQRLEGVGSINSLGSEYAMRIWLDPERMYQYQISADDVTTAVAEQNTNVSVGSLGDQPAIKGQQFTVSLSAQSQLSTVEDFEGILLKTNEDGSTVYLADVATVELGEEDSTLSSRFDGKPAAGFGVNLATGANAVDTAARVRELLDSIGEQLPSGISVEYPYDTSPFVEESINQVYHTLAEAIGLVLLIILLFLQNWRSTLIPIIAVPIVLLGTFGMLAFLGMTINTLTMFALVLAIGLLVDDAIVVVENVERVMEEEGLSPLEATQKSMHEISSALVGIVTVLSVVFLPMAFLGGSTGVIFKQFSITIITAMVLSLFVALILTPVMCVQFLKPVHEKRVPAPLRMFNTGVDRLTGGYINVVRRLITRPIRILIVVAVVAGACWWTYDNLRTGFLPTEDQGVLMTMVTLPDTATKAQTEDAVKAVEDYMLNDESDVVENVFAALGFSFDGNGQNAAMLFIKLKDFDDRTGTAGELADRANRKFANSRLGQVLFLQPPAIQGLGSVSGFTMYLVDRTGNGTDALNEAADQLVADAQEDGRVTSIRGNDNKDTPSLRMNIDQQKAKAFGMTLSDINSALTTIFASNYVNDFTLNGELREVIVQGDAKWRMQPDDIDSWYTTNDDGEMVPFAAFMTKEWVQIPPKLQHYGGTRALELSGAAATGVSSGDAMNAMAEMVSDLDGGYTSAWTGLSYQERLSGSQEPLLYSLSVLVVFLCLAVLYESWTVPFAVLLAVPIGILGTFLMTMTFGQSNDIYFKVGLLTTIGLAARNAILIIEFAETLRKSGKDVFDSILLASRQRLRPILMTTLAFGFGILPLATASGAGAAAQKSIGTGMLGGIIFSATFGIILVPVLYIAVLKIVGKLPRETAAA